MSLAIGEEQIPTGEGELIKHLVALQVGIMKAKDPTGAASTRSTTAASTRGRRPWRHTGHAQARHLQPASQELIRRR